jgi:N-acetylmuramoyl-L-alanine amidase
MGTWVVLDSFNDYKRAALICAATLALCFISDCKAASASKFIVAIDIGHSVKSSGALSARGMAEFNFNRRLALSLFDVLKKTGYNKTFLINENGELAGKDGLRERTKVAQQRNANLLISIHHDSVKEQFLKRWNYKGKSYRYSDDFEGYSIIISKGNQCPNESLEFARYVGDQFLSNNMQPTMYHTLDIPGERRRIIDQERGIYDIEFWVVDKATMPSVLIEAGMITNRHEEKKLSSQSYIDMLNKGIASAVDEYVKSGSAQKRDCK